MSYQIQFHSHSTMINQQQIKKDIFDFLKNQSKTVQDDPDKAMDAFADKLSSTIVKAIKSADIVVPIGNIVVVGASGPSNNVAPILIKNSLK